MKLFLLTFALLFSSVAFSAPTYKDVKYGQDPKQALDIYSQQDVTKSPAIVMVHGGAWTLGDKAYSPVWKNKVERWLPMGVTIVAVNYRFLTPLDQVDDVRSAMVFIRDNADKYGIDKDRIILMGHSSGGHVSALLAATEPNWWAGTVILDSAAMDVVAKMQSRHLKFYDTTFGKDIKNWELNSPLHQLNGEIKPMLIVCSTSNPGSCSDSVKFARKSGEQLIKLKMKHGEVNTDLGLKSDYTDSVERFMSKIGVLK